MTAAISTAGHTLGRLATEADQLRKKIEEKAAEMGALTQELFVIDAAMKAVIEDVYRSQIYNERGQK